MGYFNDVSIIMKKIDFNEFKKRMEKQKCIQTLELLKEGKDEDPSCFTNEEYLYLHWNSVKWFNSRTKPLDDFLKELDSKNSYYEFIRIGEELTDIEQYGENRFMYVDRASFFY